MISKNKAKFVQSLSSKKTREESGLFIAEGEKLITELSNAGFRFEMLFLTDDFQKKFAKIQCEKIITHKEELAKISSLMNPSSALAICYQRRENTINTYSIDDLTLALDNIQDPGNFGTIVRTASWFGIRHILCSENTVDCYNPKVIQATMGAIAHVKIIYTDLRSALNNYASNEVAIYGTFMEGKTIYREKLKENAIVVFGNEGKGISKEVQQVITHKISIPSFRNGDLTVESLNVSIAASIVCSEFRRRKME